LYAYYRSESYVGGPQEGFPRDSVTQITNCPHFFCVNICYMTDLGGFYSGLLTCGLSPIVPM